ncbi:MAG: lipoyl(octanoyl) transferase LipB [Alphaproteobacteria bacterium]|nr:lipoyl(octanoyl) transferase LipB [Alphaproteobacteria bacterium]
MTRFVHLAGATSYREVHALQAELLDQRIRNVIPDTVLLLEHAPVFTVGRTRGAMANVLDPGEAEVVEVERGGDVTWHGPGQLVAYPIVDLRNRREDLHLHMHSLEEAVIRLLADLGVPSGRDDRNTGVWIEGHKVCSIGIACRRWVTWHGLALNVDPDPSWFQRINPCGFDSAIMTRLADHLDPCPSVGSLVQPLADHLADCLDIPRAPVGSTLA